MGGMVLETNMNEIVAQVELQNRMEKSEVSQLSVLKDRTAVFTFFHPTNHFPKMAFPEKNVLSVLQTPTR